MWKWSFLRDVSFEWPHKKKHVSYHWHIVTSSSTSCSTLGVLFASQIFQRLSGDCPVEHVEGEIFWDGSLRTEHVFQYILNTVNTDS